MSGYKRDLAWIHDSAFTDFVRDAAPWLLKTLRRNRIRDGLVVDLGCGSGRWAAELLRAGYEVEGIDLSPAMIALARRHAPRGTFWVGSLLSAKIPRCAAVTALGECVNYAFDRRNSAAALKRFFRGVHDALDPGGVFIFDAAEPGLVGARPARRWLAGKDWAILLDLTENPRQKTAVRRMIVFRRVGGTWRRTEETHPLRLYRRHELKGWLEGAGFKVQTVKGYGKPFRPALVGFVCKRVG